MAGFVVIFWAAPVMTAGHLLFAATATGYILAGIAFEEHDLIQSLGGTYAAYRARVPALIPRLLPRRHWPGLSDVKKTTPSRRQEVPRADLIAPRDSGNDETPRSGSRPC